MSSQEGNNHAQRSLTSSGRPSTTDSIEFNPPSGVMTPSSRVSRPLTMKIDEDSRYRAVSPSNLQRESHVTDIL
jgi:hypothetical protein